MRSARQTLISPATLIRYCPRRSASARPARLHWRRWAWPSPTCGRCARGAARRLPSTRGRQLPRCAVRATCRWMLRIGSYRSQQRHGVLSRQKRTLGLPALQLPESPCRRSWSARRRGRSGCGSQSGRPVGRTRARGGHHRRQGRWWNGAHHGRVVSTSAGRSRRLAAADGDRQDRRQSTGGAAGRRPASVRESVCWI